MSTLTKDQRRNILSELARLGGGVFRPEDDIVHEGDRIIIPAGMSMESAVKFLSERIIADQETIMYSRQYRYRPQDGAVCTFNALKRVFGMVNLVGTPGFFGPNPPRLRDVKIGAGEVLSVPWGGFQLPIFDETTIYTNAWEDPELGTLFALSVEAPRKYRAEIEGIFTAVQTELETNSIYRGKAFDGQEEPDFLDLSGVSPDKVVYAQETLVQLDANIWSVMRHRDELAKAGISRKRAALLYGPYGTGKTLCGFLTAQQAVESGWTFIYARPGRDDIHQVLASARLYQPACVFFEDLDTVSDPESASADAATKLLDVFDGITAKGTELVVVLTTNHPDRIHRGMLRPGRLDSVIELAGLDEDGVSRLISSTLPAGSLVDDIDWSLVFKAADTMLPAYVKEAADRAFRYGLARVGHSEDVVLTTEDLIHAIEGLKPQLELMEGASDARAVDTVGNAFRLAVREGMADHVVADADGAWPLTREALEAAQRRVSS